MWDQQYWIDEEPQDNKFHSVRNFQNLKGGISRLIKSLNNSSPVAGRIGYTVQENLEGLAYWMMDHIRCNIALEVIQWNKMHSRKPRKLTTFN
jgi:hypothetical protein